MREERLSAPGPVAVGLIRPFTLLAPAVGVVTGALVAKGAGASGWHWPPVVWGVVSAMFATAASNTWNQAFDAPLDRINKPRRPIPAGRISARNALALGHAMAAAALVCGWFASVPFFVCVAVGVVATWIYSAPPLRTKRLALGALLTMAIPRGLLVPVAGWGTLAPVDTPDPWALGAVTFLFVLGASATKDFADIEGDREHGCRTLPVLLGPARAARLIAPFLIVPFLLYPLFAAAGWLTAPMLHVGVLAGVLSALGAAAAFALLRDPAALARRGGNHPAWAMMYLLMLGAHAGSALAYNV